MMYENDKLIIPERYKKMSVSELRCEREKLYIQIKKENKVKIQKMSIKQETIVFRF